MATLHLCLMKLFFVIAGYLWFTMPDNYDTLKYHRDFWLKVWGQVKELFADIKAGKHNRLVMYWFYFAVWIFIAAVVIFIITGLAFWLKS